MAQDAPAAPRSSRTGSLKAAFGNLVWLLGSRGLSAVLSLGYLAIIARSLGPSGFGQFALITGTAQTISGFVSFQTWQIVVQFGMPHLRDGREEPLARLILSCVLLDLAASAAGSLIALPVILFMAAHFGWSSGIQWSAWAFCCLMLFAMRSASVGVLRLYDRYSASASADSMTPVMRMAGALTVYALGASVLGFLVAWGVAELVALIAFRRASYRAAGGLRFSRALLSWDKLRQENPGIARFALATNGSTTFKLASRQLPVLFVGFFASAAAAGGYRLTHQLGRSMALASQLFTRALFPELMRIRGEAGGAERLSALLRRITLGSTAIGIAIALLLLLAGKPLLGLVAGPDFLPAYPLLLLLGFAAVIELIGVGFEPVLIANGQAGSSMRIQAVSAIVLIVLMIVLLPRIGAAGGAVAVLGASLLNFVLMAVAAFRSIRRGEPVTPAAAKLIEGNEEEVEAVRRDD